MVLGKQAAYLSALRTCAPFRNVSIPARTVNNLQGWGNIVTLRTHLDNLLEIIPQLKVYGGFEVVSQQTFRHL